MKRKLAVAGIFYPSERESLRDLLSSLCGEEPQEKLRAKAVLVPHAGLIYSGKTACAVYRSVLIPERIVLLGPNHTGLGAEISVYPGEAWESPYGDVLVDEELREKVVQYPYASPDEDAHLYEHSLEVQLPFLFRYAEHPFQILPITLGFLSYERARDFGRFLGGLLEGLDALIVISSDMSHYVPAEEAKRKDRILLSAMEKLQTEELYFKRISYNVSMCGFVAAVVGIEASKVLGARKGILVDYTNSGEVSGDWDRVVAYAGMLFL